MTGEDDDVEIISAQDEKIKLIGEIFSNDSCRKILKLISDDNEMTANEIAQKNDMSLTLTIHHLKRMQTAGMVKIPRTGISAKGQEMKYYVTTNHSFLITPEQPTHSIMESLKKASKFAAIGLAGFVSWVTLRPGGKYDMQQTDGTEQTNPVIDTTTTADSDTWSSLSAEEINLKGSNAVRTLTDEPVQRPESSHSGVQDFALQADSDFVDAGSVSLDRTVYPTTFDTAGAEYAEPFLFSIMIPIVVVAGGIILERTLTRWFHNRKQDKNLNEES